MLRVRVHWPPSGLPFCLIKTRHCFGTSFARTVRGQNFTAELRIPTPAGHCVVLHSRWEEPKVAAAIISAGPEPLQSQFATGYNMAANLLRTRSLDEARAFIERSFGNYLGVSPARHMHH